MSQAKFIRLGCIEYISELIAIVELNTTSVQSRSLTDVLENNVEIYNTLAIIY